MWKSFGNFGGLLVLCVFAGTGCDTLRARMVAGDAVELYKQGKLQESISKYEEAARLDPDIATVHLNLGFANLAAYQASPKSKEGNAAADKAVQAFESFLKLKPGDERATQYLTQTFVDTGRYDAAVAYFQPQAQKNDPTAFNTLGIIASKTGKYEQALDWYTKRAQADSRNADAYLTIGVVMWDHLHGNQETIKGDARKKEADDAIKVLQKAIDLAPKNPNGYTYVNLIYRERAAAALNDDEKRADIVKANEFYKKAMELQTAAKK